MREREALLAAIHRATLVVKAATGRGRFESAMARLGKLLHDGPMSPGGDPNARAIETGSSSASRDGFSGRRASASERPRPDVS